MNFNMDTNTCQTLDQDMHNFLTAAQTDLERVHHSLILAAALGANFQKELHEESGTRVIEMSLEDIAHRIETALENLREEPRDERL